MATQSRTNLLALALLLLPCIVMGNSRDLLVRASSSARSGDGLSIAIAKSSSKEISIAKNAIAESVAFAISNARGKNLDEVEAIASSQAEAIGKAVAKAVASVVAEVFVEGQGRACADGKATASAEAKTYATAFAQAVAEATKGENVADANAIAEKITSGSAKAYAEAEVDACTTSGRVSAFQEVIAVASIKVYAVAYADALALVTDHDAESISEALAESGILDEKVNVSGKGGVTVDGQGSGNARGDGGADTSSKDVPLPPGGLRPTCQSTPYGRNCCKQRKVDRGVCKCGSRQCFLIDDDQNRIIFERDGNPDIQCECKTVQPARPRSRFNRRNPRG